MKSIFLIYFLIASSCFAQVEVLSRTKYELKYGAFPQERIWGSMGYRNSFGQWKGAGRNKIAYNFKAFAFQRGLDFSKIGSEDYLDFVFELGTDGRFKSVIYGIYLWEQKEGENQIRISYKNEFPAGLEERMRTIIFDFCRAYRMNSISLNSEYYSFSVPLKQTKKRLSENRINSLEEALANTQPDTVTKVDFSELKLTEIPEVLIRFKNLKELDLSENYIENLSPKLWKLKTLKHLDLSRNLLENKSFKVRRNHSLEVLNLQFNRISEMLAGIKKLKDLKDLLLGNNNLITLKDQHFKALANLKSLNLYNGELEELPKFINELEGLEELDIYYNSIAVLPENLGQLKNLKTLALSNNRLWKLPENIAKLNNLEKLYAHHNKINSLPTLPGTLKYLDIGYNDFQVLPVSILSLNELEELDISNNDLEEVPFGLKRLQKMKTLFQSLNSYTKDKALKAEYEQFIVDLEQQAVDVK